MAKTIRWLVEHQDLGATPGKEVTLSDEGLADTYVKEKMAVEVATLPKQNRQIKTGKTITK